MPRKMIVSRPDRSRVVLSESPVDNESQLQAVLKEHPDLLPVEEVGLPSPLMVVGEETVLPSGSVDLVAMTRAGHIIVVECKTGPQNSDFRNALAQLLDYGSDLCGMAFEQFEHAVALRYLRSERCREPGLRKADSLEQAARLIWRGLSAEQWATLKDKLQATLRDGAFEYYLGAQGFTPAAERTIAYLNQITRGPRSLAEKCR